MYTRYLFETRIGGSNGRPTGFPEGCVSITSDYGGFRCRSEGGPAPGNPTPPDQAGLPKEPLQEQRFQQYHLLGSPDQNANLLGPACPQNWRSTKEGLTKALLDSAHHDDPIHKWLKTFRMNFDERATGIVLDARSTIYKSGDVGELTYEPQLYDGLLRGAAGLLEHSRYFQ
jgi:hypothetical protein